MQQQTIDFNEAAQLRQVERLPLRTRARRLLAAMIRHHKQFDGFYDKQAAAYVVDPSNSELAHLLGTSEKTVRRARADAAAAGYLIEDRNTAGGRNLYQILMRPIFDAEPVRHAPQRRRIDPATHTVAAHVQTTPDTLTPRTNCPPSVPPLSPPMGEDSHPGQSGGTPAPHGLNGMNECHEWANGGYKFFPQKDQKRPRWPDRGAIKSQHLRSPAAVAELFRISLTTGRVAAHQAARYFATAHRCSEPGKLSNPGGAFTRAILQNKLGGSDADLAWAAKALDQLRPKAKPAAAAAVAQAARGIGGIDDDRRTIDQRKADALAGLEKLQTATAGSRGN